MPVYAHNWPAFRIWRATWRQWRYVSLGMAGATRAGLDWAQVESVMRMQRILPRQRTAICEALAEMETAALEVLSKR
ncbi:DUF1799 domain-containing protein [Thauera sinica]|uniref:DUF1799 domain-containing protein n=1 Tax=Thauera sinica TaxID=2665146 RepID=A0ABW1ARM6_9RHOO